jgi:hypothetical protein
VSVPPLADDVPRCAGWRDDVPPRQADCPLRNGCRRYLALVDNDIGPRTVVELWMCKSPQFECRIEVE